MSTDGEEEYELFSKIVEGISNDRFLAFIDAFVTRNALRDDLVWPSAEAQGDSTFSIAHFQVFSQYQAMFESRVGSTLRKGGAGGRPFPIERFVKLCQECVEPKQAKGQQPTSSSSGTEKERGDEKNRNDEAPEPRQGGDVAATKVELCEALLSMVMSIGDFPTFCRIMHEKQQELQSDELGDDDDDAS